MSENSQKTDNAKRTWYLAATSFDLTFRQPLTQAQVDRIALYRELDGFSIYTPDGTMYIIGPEIAGVQQFESTNITQYLVRLNEDNTFWPLESHNMPDVRMKDLEPWLQEIPGIIKSKTAVNSFPEIAASICALWEEEPDIPGFFATHQLSSIGLELERITRQRRPDKGKIKEAFLSYEYITGDDFLTLLADTPLWWHVNSDLILELVFFIDEMNFHGLDSDHRFMTNRVSRLAGRYMLLQQMDDDDSDE